MCRTLHILRILNLCSLHVHALLGVACHCYSRTADARPSQLSIVQPVALFKGTRGSLTPPSAPQAAESA